MKEECKKTEDLVSELQRRAQLLEGIINATPDLIFVKDHELRTVLCNKMFADAVGKRPEEMYGHTDIENGWDPLLVKGDPKKGIRGFENDDRDALSGKTIRNSYDPANIRGETRVFDTRKIPLKDKTGKIIGVLGISRDITENNRIEEVIKESECRCRSLFEYSMDGLLVADIENKRFIAANPAVCRMLGCTLEELLRLGVEDIHPPDQLDYVVEQFESQVSGNFHLIHDLPVMRKDGSVFYADINSCILTYDGKDCLLGVFRDVTQRKEMEERKNKIAKLESLGTLAGGIAHDFNNLLAGIYGYIEAASKRTQDEKVSGPLQKAMLSIGRAKSLTHQLVTFAGGGAPVRKAVPVSPVIKEVVKFSLSGSNVSANFELPPDLWHCNIDKEQVFLALSNIVINARQAMYKGGSVRVSAENVYLKTPEGEALSEGNYVKISIRDSGGGMTQETQRRVFDPFFTTKQSATGLGLAVSYSIIKKHEGWIDVESEAAKGSAFHVYLPAAIELQPLEMTSNDNAEQKSAGRVLIMDDQEDLCDSLTELLDCFGYSAICAKDGREAIELFSEEKKANRLLSAIILDLTIPDGMGGVETVAEIRKLDSKVPVFVSTGYSSDSVSSNPAAYGFTASIGKPFRIEDLIKLIKDYE